MKNKFFSDFLHVVYIIICFETYKNSLLETEWNYSIQLEKQLLTCILSLNELINIRIDRMFRCPCVHVVCEGKKERKAVFACVFMCSHMHIFYQMNKTPSGYTHYKTMLLRTQSEITFSAYVKGDLKVTHFLQHALLWGLLYVLSTKPPH